MEKILSFGQCEYRWFDFYHTLRPDEKIEYFIPNNLFQAYIDMYFNDYRICRSYDDKNMYNLYFPDAIQPETVFRSMGRGYLLDDNFLEISQEQAVKRCKGIDGVIIKPAVGTDGGRGIVFWNNNEDNEEKLIKSITAPCPFVVQKVINQHKALSLIHSSSINTIRIMTLCWRMDCLVLSAVLRMGINGSKVDNVSAGGIACGINWDGCLKEKAYSSKGESYLKHPQGLVFGGYMIPGFDKCVELVKRLAPRMSRFSKMISWDLAVNQSGDPVLIEANFSYGQLDFHQMCNGPIFGEKTEEILNTVFKKKVIFKW